MPLFLVKFALWLATVEMVRRELGQGRSDWKYNEYLVLEHQTSWQFCNWLVLGELKSVVGALAHKGGLLAVSLSH